MRTARWMGGCASVGLALAFVHAGCSNTADDCGQTLCDVASTASGSSSSSGASSTSSSTSSGSSSSSSSSSGTGGGGGGTPGSCVPSEVAGAVADDCGVFVSSSKGNDGTAAATKAAPAKTLAKAIELAGKGKKRIYACGEAFVEAVTVPAGLTLYGGLDCGKDWSHGTTKTALTPVADEVPLTLSSGSGTTHIEDVAATAMTGGGSSIAVIADGATAVLLNCELTAGKGAAGAAPTPPVGSGAAGADAPTPAAGALDGCKVGVTGVLGGQPGNTTCDGMTDTSGGLGGAGTNQAAGAVGASAPPFPAAQPNAMVGSDGLGGKQQDATACKGGDDGAAGLPGSSGTGATGIGNLTAAGYSDASATAGASTGTPGYGGGGGGGAHKCAIITEAGPAGGGGGAGGCGGQAGAAGQSAGSSIGLVSHGATLTLTSVKITAVAGGGGGAGGDGQPGGQGGKAGVAGNGDAIASACNGGKGGQGGRGGSGGGGLGGHSFGIAFTGTAPTRTMVTFAIGAAGMGGVGGDADATAKGADGMGCKTIDFANAGSCTQ